MQAKRFYSAVMALSVALSGILCSCGNSGTSSEVKNDDIKSITEESKVQETKSEKESKDKSDKIFTEYLSQQKLCKISRNFRVLEPGAARDNPNGLAGAVKFDFDGDKKDELVTFTFERNDQNGEDIRIDFLKADGKKLSVADSKYITELIDINDAEGNIKSDSVFFGKIMSMQLVSSEYQGSMYFGFVLNNEDNIFQPNPPRAYMKSMSVFTIENGAITPCTIAGTYQNYSTLGNEESQGVLYATLLPPSIRDTTSDTGTCIPDEKRISMVSWGDSVREESKRIISEIDEEIKNKGYYTLFANVYSTIELKYAISGGLYSSITSAFSALLNEFGMDLEYQNYSYDDRYECSAKFVPKNQAKVKTILEIDAVRGYTTDCYTDSYNKDNAFIASKLTVSSDLESLLGKENLFEEPYESELSLYEDILCRPHFYSDIWDTYDSMYKEDEDSCNPGYFIADINNDSKYELVICSDSGSESGCFSIVMPDASVQSYEFNGELNFLNNGVVFVKEDNPENNGSNVHYFSIDDKSHWVYSEQTQDNSTDADSVCITNTLSEESLTGEDAKKKIEEFNSAYLILPSFTDFSLYNYNIKNIEVIEDISEIICTWQKAYLKCINEIKYDHSESMKYSLIYINNDEIPELIFDDKHYSGWCGIYSFYNNSLVEHKNLGSREFIEGYVEKGNVFGVYSFLMAVEGHSIYRIENGVAVETDSFSHPMQTGEYIINDEAVSEEEYQSKYREYADSFSEITYSTYDEIVEILNKTE